MSELSVAELTAGFMKCLQWENKCRQTGEPCRELGKCGCWGEVGAWCRDVRIKALTD